MFPCLCAQGFSVAEYLDFSRIAVKRDTCVLVCLYALRGFTRPSYISRVHGVGGAGGVWQPCIIYGRGEIAGGSEGAADRSRSEMLSEKRRDRSSARTRS